MMLIHHHLGKFPHQQNEQNNGGDTPECLFIQQVSVASRQRQNKGINGIKQRKSHLVQVAAAVMKFDKEIAERTPRFLGVF